MGDVFGVCGYWIFAGLVVLALGFLIETCGVRLPLCKGQGDEAPGFLLGWRCGLLGGQVCEFVEVAVVAVVAAVMGVFAEFD